MNRPRPVSTRKLLTWLGVLMGAAGLVLQFVLSLQVAHAAGRDIPGFLGHFLAFYTILTNVTLVLIYLSELFPRSPLAPFHRPVVRGFMAANIALVGLYVFFVLRFINPLEGIFLVADTLLHYVCPTLYVLWWLLTQTHNRLRWADLPAMLAPTLVYFIYILARGTWVQQYPYPILNVVELGYPAVLLNAVTMALALAVLCLAVIGLDKGLGRRRLSAII
ncbi:MAG: Pr6Pr family membrane protein [Candidatus Devosia phytovorans]|uniref:Pr6Pr family membrane protein n=1 Tax=Candidatus Devosia phytovorans TaxID=3121372 RepID=A0AAJ6B1B3_9HYPH|nr:Pr6Pr family membrane protein [Devosia sp.]WEK05601.1 MAG: Pr6Pr family membrane protein [Devosia sp.]